jgi:hypothetical protein
VGQVEGRVVPIRWHFGASARIADERWATESAVKPGQGLSPHPAWELVFLARRRIGIALAR